VEGSRNIMKNLRIPGVTVVSKRDYNSGVLLLEISRGQRGRR
jgi:hypothetical protein